MRPRGAFAAKMLVRALKVLRYFPKEKPARASPRQPLISRAIKAGLMTEVVRIGNAMNREDRSGYLWLDVYPASPDKTHDKFRNDCRLPPPAQPPLDSRCRRPRSRCRPRRGRCQTVRPAAAMTASGMSFSPPPAAIAAPATAFPSRSRAAGSPPPAAAGSRARSIAAAASRSRSRSAPRMPAAAAGSRGISGAGSWRGVISGDRCSGTWQATRT